MNMNMQKVILSFLSLGILAGLWFLVIESNEKIIKDGNTEKPVSAVSINACYVGGCSSQICSDQKSVFSTCEYLAEYACYKTAKCERQTNGQCGWTETEALKKCLSKSGNAGVY